VLRTTLLNYEQGRPWREPRPALGRGLFDRAQGLRAALPGGQAAAAFDEGEPEVRVRIDTTGVWALDATELLARYYPSGVPIAEVSVHRHEFVENMLALQCQCGRRNMDPDAHAIIAREFLTIASSGLIPSV
jgi:hypothetical protein